MVVCSGAYTGTEPGILINIYNPVVSAHFSQMKEGKSTDKMSYSLLRT
jgi:hypothetical protein